MKTVGQHRLFRPSNAFAASAIVLSAACSSGSDENLDRADLFTDIASSTDLSAPSDLAGLQGSATFDGVAIANFGGFSGTGDATIRANFSDRSLSGELTNWEDGDAANFDLSGSVVISNGQIANDGTFDAQVAGNIERSRRGPEGGNAPELLVFTGTAEGGLYDKINGQSAGVVVGTFDATADSVSVTGDFIAER